MENFRQKIVDICDKYNVELMGVITNIQGTRDVSISGTNNEKVRVEIEKLDNINDVMFHN